MKGPKFQGGDSSDRVKQPRLSIVIPTRNRRRKLLRCVESVLESISDDVEVIVVDDCSDYDVRADFVDNDRVTVIRNEERRLLAFSRNVGAAAASGSFVFFLDDDNVVGPGTVQELARVLESRESAAVCSPVIFTLAQPSKVWTSYIRKGRFPGFYVLGLGIPPGITPTFSFHDAFMVRREAFEALGGFDARDFPIHFGELDLAYKLELSGYECFVNPQGAVWHDVGKTHMHVDSVRSFYTLRNRIILLKKYESRQTLFFYLFCILPPLTIYYSVHHLRGTIDHRFRATFNLLKGVISGIATPVASFSPRLHPQIPSIPKKGVIRGNPLVSVIVPTMDSARTLRTCLDSLGAQTYPRIEVIVVDNFSEDNTLAIAKSYPRVKVLSAGPERAAQFNAGARKAGGEFLYRVDSDFVVGPGVIAEAVSKCVEEGYKVITVHNTSDPTKGFWARVRKLERDCYSDDDAHIAARFFDRSLFESVGGFDPGLIAAEDYDLHNRLKARGFKIGRIRSNEIHIGEPRSLRDVIRKHIFYGTKITEFIKKTPRSVWITELSPLRAAYVRHWRDFAADPKLTFGFAVYQYVRFASAVAGYVSSLA